VNQFAVNNVQELVPGDIAMSFDLEATQFVARLT